MTSLLNIQVTTALLETCLTFYYVGMKLTFTLRQFLQIMMKCLSAAQISRFRKYSTLIEMESANLNKVIKNKTIIIVPL